jgi:serine/threonine protein kinase
MVARSFSDANRWHADIKPDNILVIEESDTSGITRERFKLADPGFAQFVAKTSQDQRVVLNGGTETYGK